MRQHPAVSLRGILPLFLLLAGLLAFAPGAAAEESPAAGAPCAPSLDALFAPETPLLQSVEPEADGAVLLARPPFFRSCRCTCGAPCETDADCNGGKCTSGITCCAGSDAKEDPLVPTVPLPSLGAAAADQAVS